MWIISRWLTHNYDRFKAIQLRSENFQCSNSSDSELLKQNLSRAAFKNETRGLWNHIFSKTNGTEDRLEKAAKKNRIRRQPPVHRAFPEDSWPLNGH